MSDPVDTAQDLLQRLCRYHGGYYVPFSQSRGPVREMIARLPQTRNGICQALAARWMVEHANGGSLWKWLGINRIGDPVDKHRIGRLMVTAVEFATAHGYLANPSTELTLENMDVRIPQMGDLQYQDFVTTKYLDFWASLRRRTLPQDHVLAQTRQGFGLHAGLVLSLRLNRRTLLSPGGCYVLIGLTGGRSGHALSAFVGHDIAFFDPNFGEFYFEANKPNDPTGHNRAFVAWFLEYWKFSGYSQRYDTFRLISYGKRQPMEPYQGNRSY